MGEINMKTHPDMQFFIKPKKPLKSYIMGSLCGLCILGSAAAVAAEKPNILLIVADDLAYSDLGSYGGEIDTPQLDRLAASGIRFSDFNVNPMCVVTRTSLLTGHTHSQSDNYRRSLPVAHLLREAGYATFLSGKWHQNGSDPLGAGFASFYGFLHGAINSWTGSGRIQRDRNKPSAVPADWYSSDAFTDEALNQMEAARQAGQPFFAYVAYNAPHSPLHAPRENVEKYYDRYRAGWEALRQQRFERLQAMGMIDERFKMTPPGAEVRQWEKLPASTQELEARRMAAYAGMVDRMDWNIGRLLDYLEENALEENTFVVFLSDNGGDYSNGNIATYDQQVPWQANSSPFSSNGWSYLQNTPFRFYKHSAHRGGVSVPLIIRWPAEVELPPGSILHQRLHVTDLYPTFLELSGSEYPPAVDDRNLAPLYGQSILPLLEHPDLPDYAIHNEIHWGLKISRGLVQDDWKICALYAGPWQLFNLRDDPAESNDLAQQIPERVEAMARCWFDFANNETAMSALWKRPTMDRQLGWGYHRIASVWPSFQYASPQSSATGVPVDTDLRFKFAEPLSFDHSKGKTIRLYSEEEPDRIIWQADPEPGHPAEGAKAIIFNDLPRLKPDTTYFVLTDNQWLSVGGKPAKALNDGAYWYRFRTVSEPLRQSKSGFIKNR